MGQFALPDGLVTWNMYTKTETVTGPQLPMVVHACTTNDVAPEATADSRRFAMHLLVLSNVATPSEGCEVTITDEQSIGWFPYAGGRSVERSIGVL